MSRKANKTAIGVFTVGAVILLLLSLVVFGSGVLFKQTTRYVLFFDGSVKGLSVGAPVIFRGVKVGLVKDINLVYDPKDKAVLIPVIIELELNRVKGAPAYWGDKETQFLIERGLQARLEIQNFITSQLMISLDFYPQKEAKLHGFSYRYPEIPTLPISPDIFALMEEMPLKQISDNLGDAVEGLNKLVNSGSLQENLYELKNALQEVTQVTRSMRLFIEYIEQHPEAFLKGKPSPKGE